MSTHFCGTWFEIAINTLIRLGDVDPQVGQRAVEAVEEIVRALPEDPLTRATASLPERGRVATASDVEVWVGLSRWHQRTTSKLASISC
jgi:hypothetical protein